MTAFSDKQVLGSSDVEKVKRRNPRYFQERFNPDVCTYTNKNLFNLSVSLNTRHSCSKPVNPNVTQSLQRRNSGPHRNYNSSSIEGRMKAAWGWSASSQPQQRLRAHFSCISISAVCSYSKSLTSIEVTLWTLVRATANSGKMRSKIQS